MSDTTTEHTSAQEAGIVDEHISRLLAEHPPEATEPTEFWGAQFDLGLAWVDFPVGLGGLGVSPRHRELVARRLAEAGADTSNHIRNVIGIGMGAGTLLAHGSFEQQERLLRPMFTTEEVWCQLFSEPGAGSDLAGLATSAIPDGGDWVVNGQKVWTTLAHEARWGLLVTRTDPDDLKHKGLTYFLLDMHSEGVEVRPLYQITGEAEFNEVYLTDVRIPDENRLAEVGAGWGVAMTTLMNERVAIGGRPIPRGTGVIQVALQAWEDHGGDDPVLRDELARLWAETEALRLTVLRAAENAQEGTPGPEGSTAKLAWADLNKEVSAFAMEILGDEATLMPGGYELRRPDKVAFADVQRVYLRCRANSIEGGTSEIMRNILGERVLGLPGEPRVDRGMPWREVPRS